MSSQIPARIKIALCLLPLLAPSAVGATAAPRFHVGKGDQTITFTSTAPASAQVGGPTYTVTATASSGLPVTLSIDATATSICTISGSTSGSTVSFIGAGTCVIDANQAGNANYNPAPQVQQSFPVSASAPALKPALKVASTAGYYTVTPCRILDTRSSSQLQAGIERTIPIVGSCGVPADATAVMMVASAVTPSASGHIQLYPTPPAPATSSINFPPMNSNHALSNNAIVEIALDGSIKALLSTVPGGGTADLTLDVHGFIKEPPFAKDDTYSTPFNTPLSVPAPGVLGNDLTPRATIVSYGATTGAEQTTIGAATPTSAGGSVTLNADGSFSYTPPSGFAGDDTFKYVIQNGVASSTATVDIGVGKGDQTITFTSAAPANAKVGGPTYTVTATASSGLPVTLSIDASAIGICSLSGSTSGSTVSFQSVGTCVINANQAGDANYNPAPQVQQSFPVDKGDQTITFTSTPPANAMVGGPTYTVTATATSGLPVTFSIDASATSVCSISGSTVSFLSVGTCVIDANQAGDTNWNPAPQAQQSFAVAKGDQTITFTSTPPLNPKVGGTYIVTATASSGLPVTLSIDATATSVCSISGSTSGSTVTFNATGTCVIDANQAGDANWNAASQAQQSIPVGKADQTITFTSTVPVNAKVGGPTYTVTATASSGLPVTLTIDATSTAICSLSGSTSGSAVSFLAAGTCVIDANQAGDANYNAAPQVQQSVPVAKGDQTITFTSTAPVNAKVGGPTYTVTATASSGLAVTLSIDATSTSVCTISGSTSGSTVSFIGVGTCVIDANQAGDANWNPAPQAQQSVPVAKGDQTITFTSTPPVGAKVGQTYIVTATASSGLPVTLSIDAASTSICSISGSTSGSTVTFNAVGTCVIDANQAGNANWNPAPQAQQSVPVAKGDQTITFTSTPPVGAKVGQTYIVTATASSGLPVTLSIDASSTSICSISGSTSGSTVTFNAVGTCVIDANQAGDANWNPAPQAQQSVPVAKGDQTITFTSTPPVNAKVGGPGYVVTATASSGLPVTLSIDATATSICTISGSTSGSTVSFIGAGTCVIDANQAGNANYNAAPQAQQTFTVAKGDQTITFTSTAPVNAKVGGPGYVVTATASSGLPVTLSIDATATSICTISGSTSGSTVSFIGAGTCVIDANQAGNANYNAATQVQQTFAVAKGDQLITFTSTAPVNAHVGNTYVVTATASSGLPVVLSIDATATSKCSISGSTSGSTVTFTAIGTCVIDASQPGNANWNPAPQAQQSVDIINTPPTPIASPKESFQTIGNTAFDFRPSATSSPGIFVSGKLLDNFQPDIDGPSPLSVTLGTATAGAVVTIDSSTGAFTYIPPAGKTGSDTFTYVVSDGMDSVTRTVTINFVNRVWYVKNNATAGGLGRSNDPFDTLGEAQSASGNGDYIFVYFGDGTNTGQNAGIVLKSGQHLLGEHVGLSVAITSGTFNGTPAPTNVDLVTAVPGNRPIIDGPSSPAVGTGHGVEAVDIIPAEVRGISVGAEPVTNGGRNAIEWRTAAAFASSGAFTISDNVVRGGLNGIHISLVGSGATSLSLHDNTVTSSGKGVDIQETGTGALTITDFANNTVSGNNGGTGISVNTAIFDASVAAGFQTVYAGNTAVGVSGNGVGGSGVVLANVQGDLRFGDGANAGSLNVFADSGAGLQVSGTGAGFQIQVQPSTSTIEAISGPAVDVTSATIDLRLTSLKSTNSGSTGVSLDTVAGTFSAGNASSISNATGTDFDINAGNAAVTYDGTITDSTGSGSLVSVTSTTGGTKSFTGSISDSGSITAHQGIFLNANSASTTINFSGQLTLSTGASDAFTATGGGTVTATNTASTVVTTTGRAINVQNTTIGASGLKFKSVSAGNGGGGPASGIVLNNTGTLGGLTVSGTGSAGSGGTIQKTTGNGIALTSTKSVNLSWMNVANSAQDGINGASVNGLSLTNLNVTNSGTSGNHQGIKMTDLQGTATFTNLTVTGSTQHNVWIDNTTGTLASLSVSGGTFGSTNNAFSTATNGFLAVARGTSTITTASITGATFSSNFSSGLQVQAGDTASIGDFSVSGNTFTNNGAAAADFDQFGSGNITFHMLNNLSITGNGGPTINAFSSSTSTGGTLKGRIDGNHVGNAAVTGSGSTAGPGIRVFLQGKTAGTLTIVNNIVRQTPGSRGIDIEALGPVATGQPVTVSDITVIGNDVNNNDTTGFALDDIYISADNQGSPAKVRAEVHGNTIKSGPGCADFPGFSGNEPWLYYNIRTAGALAELVNFGGHANANTEISTTQTSGTAAANAGVTLIAGPINTVP
jgi:uncharacterized protein YodC (DUF2158 family)